MIGWTQAQLADRLFVERGTVTNWEDPKDPTEPQKQTEILLRLNWVHEMTRQRRDAEQHLSEKTLRTVDEILELVSQLIDTIESTRITINVDTMEVLDAA